MTDLWIIGRLILVASIIALIVMLLSVVYLISDPTISGVVQ